MELKQYHADVIDHLRQGLIRLRNKAHREGFLDEGAQADLSHTISLLGDLIEEIKTQQNEPDESQRRLDANPELSTRIDEFLTDPSRGVRRGRRDRQVADE